MSARSIVDDYPHRRAGHCGSGSLRDLLEHRGLDYGDGPLSEGFVFGLAGGLGFYYFELPDIEPPIYLVGRTGELERDFSRHLDVALDLRQTDDAAEGWRWLREALDRGEPTMVWADIKHLDYLRVRMHNTMHDIVVIGYDEDQGIALVADNDRDEIQRCSLESLARARNSRAFPAPNRHATWLMRFPRELPPLETAVERAVHTTVSNMRNDGQAPAPIPGAVGLAGVAAFATGYPVWPKRFGEKLDLALRGLRVFVAKAGTGGAMFRSLFAQFLDEAAHLLDDAALRRAAQIYEALAADWVELAEASVDEDPAVGHTRGVGLVERIATGELDGVVALERWLANRGLRAA